MKTKNPIKAIILLLIPLISIGGALTSCSEPESNLVSFVETNTLSTPNDTVYSLIGIINKMQKIADRTVLLGELRGDLTFLTPHATLSLQDLANFKAGADNPYNDARDYYAVIQNCNYYLAKADTTLTKRGEKVFAKEYAVVKTYRAWTYLQLALNYGSVPFVTKPLLTELEANPSLYPMYDVKQIADYFISDLQPYLDTEYPSYGSIAGVNSRYFYIPVRVLLGDLCLWSGRYEEAATYYHDYLAKFGDTHPTYTASVRWKDEKFEDINDSYANQFPASGINIQEDITIIPMEESKYDGIVSRLADVFSSTDENNYFYQATHSPAYDNLSQAQKYTLVHVNPNTQLPDTIVDPDYAFYKTEQMRGDLRQQSVYMLRSQASESAVLSSVRQTMTKHSSRHVRIYRLQQVYLRYAEALNRAGHPNLAFGVLKYGLCKHNLDRYFSSDEVAAAGNLVTFSEYTFTRENTQGVHARGCGDVHAYSDYCIPAFESKGDSILFVEDMISDEMALECAAEGTRYYDLMRISLHRNDVTYLANKVAQRDGTFNAELYTFLCDKKNWYLSIE